MNDQPYRSISAYADKLLNMSVGSPEPEDYVQRRLIRILQEFNSTGELNISTVESMVEYIIRREEADRAVSAGDERNYAQHHLDNWAKALIEETKQQRKVL